MSLLLQIADTAQKIADTVKNLSTTGAAPEQELHFGDLLVKGGVIMIPIGILAVLGLIIFFERYFTIRKASKNEANLLMQVRSSIVSGNLQSAIAVCKNNNSPLGRMLQKGLLRIGRPIKDIEGAIENIGKLEVAKLEKKALRVAVSALNAATQRALAAKVPLVMVIDDGLYRISASGEKELIRMLPPRMTLSGRAKKAKR